MPTEKNRNLVDATDTQANPLVSVIIPCFNEAPTIETLLQNVLYQSKTYRLEIILVDDGSQDESRRLASELLGRHAQDFQLLVNETNLGKGASIRRGIEAALGEVILIQDADLEYDPADYPRLLDPILAGDADVVYGSRFLDGKRKWSWHTWANRMLTMLSNWFTGLGLTDMETCFKAFRSEVIKKILPKLEQNGFGIEPEITARIASTGHKILEVPIRYSPRTRRQGKKIRLQDGLQAIGCIFRYRGKR